MPKTVLLAAAAAAAALLAAAAPASADELFLGGLYHDAGVGFSGTPHEEGIDDVEFGYRTKRFDNLWWLAKPYFYGKAEVNTGGRTSFYTVGIELRKHAFLPGLYGAFGLGVSAVDGYNQYPSYTDPTLTDAQRARNLEINRDYKAMGSDVVFNPNFSVGYELNARWSVEATWDHYSHAGLLGDRNPGMDNFGGRIVYKFGPRN